MSDELLGSLLAVNPDRQKSVSTKARIDVSTEKTVFDGGNKSKIVTEIKAHQEELEKKVMADRPVYVSVDHGVTLNLGNFNMGKVNVSISMPIGKELTPEITAQIDSAYRFCQKYCEDKVGDEVKKLLEVRGKL
jgi:hypothetical protein